MVMTNQNSPPLPSRYITRFREYIVQSVAHILVNVHAIDSLLPEDVRVQALHTLSYALSLPEAWPTTRELLLCMAPKMEQAGFRGEWIAYLVAGAKLSQALNDINAEAELNYHIGFLYQLLANYSEARNSLGLSSKQFAYLVDRRNQAKALNREAYVARLQRLYTEANTLVDQALALLADDEPQREFSFYVKGMIAIDNSEPECADHWFKESLTLVEKQGNRRLVALRTGNLGLAYRMQARYAEAKVCYEQSIDLFAQVQDFVQQAMMYMNLGNVYLLCNEPSEALQLYNLAEPSIHLVRDELHLAMLDLNRGIALRCLRQWQKAEQLLQHSILRWQQLGNIYWLINTMDDLGLVYFEQDDMVKAIDTFRNALIKLETIAIEPGYTGLYKSLSAHIHEARKKSS